MKRLSILIALGLVAMTLVWGAEPAQRMPESIKPVSSVMTEIRQAIGATENTGIDASRVPDSLLEELGESVMEERLGNHQMHERMDDMMGGEGSASLAAMHRQMGYNFLRGGPGGMMPGMMGGMMEGRPGFRPGPRNPRWNRPGGMMGGMMNDGGGWGVAWAWIIGILFLVLIVLAILALLRYVARPAKHAAEESALNILKGRYARGEINKDEFEAKKRDLA